MIKQKNRPEGNEQYLAPQKKAWGHCSETVVSQFPADEAGSC